MEKLKLTKEQLNALTRKIITEVFEPINTYNNELLKSIEYKEFTQFDSTCCDIMAITKRWNIDDYHAKQLCNEIRAVKFKERFKKSPNINESKVYDMLILKQIDCTDLHELIESVKNDLNLNK